MKIEFTKLQGIGNDFVVIDNRKYGFSLEQLISITPKLCNRKFGIGADGLMALHDNPHESAKFEMIYRNADGSDAGMCGNGARCIALFALKNGFGNSFDFHVHQVIYKANIELKKQSILEAQVTIDFPFKVDVEFKKLANNTSYFEAFTGTDHICLHVQNQDQFNVHSLELLGRELRYDKEVNSRGTNVNFFFREKDSEILQLETYERGVEDFTLACGTGAIASSLSNSVFSKENDGFFQKQVQCRGGLLQVKYEKSGTHFSGLSLSGSAVIVFNGEIEID